MCVEEQCLTVPGRFESLAQIAEFVSAAARSAGWDEDEAFHVQVAVDEACSNIIEHAYGPGKPGEVKLTCCIESQGDLIISIHDNGKPFDPATIPEPPLGADLEDVPEGGLGLYFMRKLMDKVEFRFDAEHGNVLTMVKRRRK
jgi:anti-sigma regulatory factor (Ser/Thr protein kinase)